MVGSGEEDRHAQLPGDEVVPGELRAVVSRDGPDDSLVWQEHCDDDLGDPHGVLPRVEPAHHAEVGAPVRDGHNGLPLRPADYQVHLEVSDPRPVGLSEMSTRPGIGAL